MQTYPFYKEVFKGPLVTVILSSFILILPNKLVGFIFSLFEIIFIGFSL